MVLWGRLGRRGEVGILPSTEPDARTLFRAKKEWYYGDSWLFDRDSLEEGQDFVTIVCNGGQHLVGGLLSFNCLCCLFVLFIVVVISDGVFHLLRYLRYTASENLKELSRF